METMQTVSPKVFILAQGKGSRWYEDNVNSELPAQYKQLIPINEKETIVSRTIRQLGDVDWKLIANYGKFKDACDETKIYELREPTGSIVQGILLLRDQWMTEDCFIFLLGDVVFSNDAIKTILEHIGKGSFLFGRLGRNKVTGKECKEIFALKVCGNIVDREDFYRFLIRVVNYEASPETLKLWDLYHLWEQERDKAGFVIIDDYTDDIDSPVHYYEFFEKMKEAADEDDRLQDSGGGDGDSSTSNDPLLLP